MIHRARTGDGANVDAVAAAPQHAFWRRLGPMDWRQVGILYRRELRSAFREKIIVFNSVLMPLFLYPLILWAMLNGMLFVEGQTEGARSRVAAMDWPKTHPALQRHVEQDKQIQLVDATGAAADLEKIRNGHLDALVEFLPAQGTNAALAGNFLARISYNESNERSITAQKRLAALVANYRAEWLDREARKLGIAPARWEWFTLDTQNVASKKEMGASILGLLLPLTFVVMVAMGCFYPAVDAVAGERERNTWETLMSTGANRAGVAAAKYLYVTTLGGLAGALNLAAIALTLKPIVTSAFARAGEVIHFTVPLAALPVLALAAVLLAGIVAAGMMIFASFARTFKEGQAMITPFYLVVILPMLFLETSDATVSPALACVPVANVMLMVRSAVSGTVSWLQVGLTSGVSLALIATCVGLAAFILQFEEVVTGSGGGWLQFLKGRLGRRPTPALAGPEERP